ncbi:nicotinate-nucleotide adenylyltransferase [Oxalicibacterium faecigallinarum]|uniref:nicotinate-nucleotide adenylyltransferase n=1 Tax=Oxalicibacterium faecigallinarum TaxID=573741 RepID=UPI001E52D66E|nr:nicotinate-nucleotide adenylyltransferase [Oxalicibacterium faecigallinarum]
MTGSDVTSGTTSATECILLLGGSFDPVHNAHVALANHFIDLIRPNSLRVIPAGNPWQKGSLHASPDDRVAMVERAFSDCKVPVHIDRQEIVRDNATYTIDTLKALRAELGPAVSLAFLIGADQLQHLNTWQGWDELFSYAHLCAASRPGFATDATHVPAEVSAAFAQRAGTPDQIRQTASGLSFVATDLSVDISATAIRAALHRGDHAIPQLPPRVLDYIEQHHLYRS